MYEYVYGETVPQQDPLDIDLARALHPNVELRFCKWLGGENVWEDIQWLYPNGDEYRKTQLWCYRPEGDSDWYVVPPYGERDGLMYEILQAHARTHTYSPNIYLYSSFIKIYTITFSRLASRLYTIKEPTFALAARKLILELQSELNET